MKPNDEPVDDASWSEMVADLLDEAEDDDAPEPELLGSGEWHRAEGYDPDAIF